jgi:hypothetical protein
MPGGAQYVVFYGNLGDLRKKLEEMAPQGYRPILMSTLDTSAGVYYTVILEHTSASR